MQSIPYSYLRMDNVIIHADPIITYASFFDTDETSGLSKQIISQIIQADQESISEDKVHHFCPNDHTN